AAIFFDIATDTFALYTTVAILLALSWLALKRPELRSRILRISAAMITALVIVRIGYDWLGPIVGGGGASDMPLPVRLNSLWHAWLSGGWWKWITVPLSTWLMTMAHLKQLFGSMTVMVQIVIAAFMLLAHGWFWW